MVHSSTNQVLDHISISLAGKPSISRPVKIFGKYAILVADSQIHVYSLEDGHIIHSFDVTGISDQGREHLFDVYEDTLVTVAKHLIFDLSSGESCEGYSAHATELTSRIRIVRPTNIEPAGDSNTTEEVWPKKLTILWTHSYHGLRMTTLPRPGEDFKTSNQDSENTPEEELLKGHHDPIWSLAISGRHAITGGGPHECIVRVWDIIRKECKWVLISHTWAVPNVAIDETQAYTAAERGVKVRIWNLETGTCTHTLDADSFGGITRTRVASSLLVTLSLDWSLCVWDTVTGKLKYRVNDIEGRPIIYVRHDGLKLLCASPKTVQLRDIQSGELLQDLTSHNEGSVVSIALKSNVCTVHRTLGDSPSDGHLLEIWRLGPRQG